MKYLSLPGFLLSIVLIALLLVGCSQFGLITGSGNIITKPYSFSNFTEIEVSNAFEVDITSSASYSVSVTAYENMFEYIVLSQDGKTLKVGLKSGYYTTSSPKATITLPDLNRLNLSGASHGTTKGFKSSNSFSLEESGASSLNISMEAGNSVITLSGASNTGGDLKAADLKIDLSGASRVDLTGSGSNLVLNASGASQGNLPNFSLQNAGISLSGASTASVNTASKLDVDISGASTLNYTGNPTLGKVSVTGASSLNHK